VNDYVTTFKQDYNLNKIFIKFQKNKRFFLNYIFIIWRYLSTDDNKSYESTLKKSHISKFVYDPHKLVTSKLWGPLTNLLIGRVLIGWWLNTPYYRSRPHQNKILFTLYLVPKQKELYWNITKRIIILILV
jgi:hypothetical protein